MSTFVIGIAAILCIGIVLKNYPVYAYLLAIGVAVLMMFAMSNDAQASTRQWYTWHATPNPNCYTYRVQEYRYGVLFGADLWHLNQKVHWCHRWGNRSKFEAGSVKRTYSQWTADLSSWDFARYDRIRARHLHNPNRWAFTVWAQFNGQTATWISVHNYPHILMVVYPNGGYRKVVHCGC